MYIQNIYIQIIDIYTYIYLGIIYCIYISVNIDYIIYSVNINIYM